MSYILALRGVHWAPRGGQNVLSDISFTVPQGQILAVCGANGAGKSSLLRLIYRHQPPTRGMVLLQGRDLWALSAPEAARCIAAVLQEQPADFALTARQIVTLGRLPHRTGWGAALGRRDAELAAEALERMEMTHLADRPFATLSGGERQRAMVARALAQDPQLIVLDEPTNHLDIRHQLELLALLRGLGRTVIATLHDLNLAAGFADRVILLHQGRILADGPPLTALSPDHLSTAFRIRAKVDTSGPAPRLAFSL